MKKLRNKFKTHAAIKTDPILKYRPQYQLFPTLKEIKELILNLVDFPFQEFLIEYK